MVSTVVICHIRNACQRDATGHFFFSLLEQLLELSSDGITDLDGGGLTTDIARTDTSLDNVLDGLLDDPGLVEHTERVLHHHGDGEDSGDGVDNTLAGNIGGRA